MNNLTVFSNPDFGSIRTVTINNKPYFCACDVARALGYARPNDAVRSHCRATVKHSTPISRKMQEINFIPEGDVYRLIVRSKLPSAEKFESWVFDTVLPSIRRNGGYIMNQENLSDSELLAKAVLVAQKTIANKDKIIEQQKAKIEQDKPKALFADAVAASHTSILIGELAKLLKQNGIETGQRRLFAWMRDNGYLIKTGSAKNMPTQRAMELGLFEIKEGSYINGAGANITTKTTKVTGKGQQYFINKFLAP